MNIPIDLSGLVIIIFLIFACSQILTNKGITDSKLMNNKFMKAIIGFFSKNK